jgi:hypothetical protein
MWVLLMAEQNSSGNMLLLARPRQSLHMVYTLWTLMLATAQCHRLQILAMSVI